MHESEIGLSRRQFLESVTVAGVAAITSGVSPSAAHADDGQRRTATDHVPRSAPSRSRLDDARELLRSGIVVDGLDPSSLTVENLDALARVGVTGWVRYAENLTGFAATLEFCDEHADRILFARSVRDIRRAHAEGKIAHICPWQDAGILISDGTDSQGCSAPAINNLRAYYDLGIRICGIAYNTANVFGGGCLEPQIGLTRLGRELVEKLHTLRILLDVGGHTGEQTSLDAIAVSAGVPVVCTHTNVAALNDNPRCTSDRVLEAIASTGGVIGVTAFSDFHTRSRRDVNVLSSPQATLERHLDQYDYLKRLIGVEHIGIGPDFTTGADAPRPGPLSKAEQVLAPPEGYSPVRPWYYVSGFESISELPNVVAGLLNRGWTPAELRKLSGENWLRVYEAAWGQ